MNEFDDQIDQDNRDTRASGAAIADDESGEVAAPQMEAGSGSGDDEPTIPSHLPVLPLRDQVAFPGTVMPLNVERDKFKQVLDLALASDKLIAVVAQRSKEEDDPKLEGLHRIGTACHILKMYKLPDGTETIIVHGIARVGIEALSKESPYMEAKVNVHRDEELTDTESEALVHSVRHAADRIMQLSPNVPDEAKIVIENIESAGPLADFLAANLSLSLVHKQELLETFEVKKRLRKVYASLSSQLEVLELSNKLQEDVRQRMTDAQREYYLREQLKAIQSELGTADAHAAELDQLKKKVEQAKLSAAASEAADRELERLAMIPQASPEYGAAMDYIDWLISVPWSKRTDDQLDLNHAEEVLNEDHFGLDRVKRRILEFLAVRKLNPEGKASILCFAGPPGVGKTSLGRSIARAMGRKFVRMALGGVRDEAEIRGHRRTYIGALPGRIIQAYKRCESNNPVFMLDEVDKIGNDFRGDPASALLEVLDPQQNDTFTDHYLEIPFDLSSTLFIATANYLEAIPPALRDRMEIITLNSYTHREKLQIAKQYLVPRQIKDNGLSDEGVSFSDDALMLIISGYTREAGVRELERMIGAVCRAYAARVVRSQASKKKLGVNEVRADLGPIKYESEVAALLAVPGVVTGLAFTPVGGEILFVEATRVPGKGQLALTGQLGEVMRESAQAAYTLLKSRARKWKIKPSDLTAYDLHVHVPAGAVPKDGPSAGVAMLTALVSVMKHKTVDARTAMTGEITLRGAVMPVGGIKEKFLAAHRAGIYRIIMPKRNVKDLEGIPAEVREQLDLVPVDSVDKLIDQAFKPAPKRRKQTTKSKTGKSTKSKKSKKTKTAKSRKVKSKSPKANSGKKKKKSPRKGAKKTKPAKRRKAAGSKKSTRRNKKTSRRT